MGLDTNAELEGVKGTTRGQGAARAAVRTNYKGLGVLVGAAVALTVGFCYLFSYILRLRELHRRDGERVMDSVGVRLNEQQYQRHNY